MGLTKQTEASLMDSSALFGTTLYLRLLQWGGDPNLWDGTILNEDGSLPTNVSEVNTGGYFASNNSVLSTAWGSAVAGGPTKKQFPKTGGSGFTFTPSGGATWLLCGYAWTTDSNAISTSNVRSFGAMVDVNGNKTLKTVSAANPLVVSSLFPIIEQFGDPGPGINPI